MAGSARGNQGVASLCELFSAWQLKLPPSPPVRGALTRSRQVASRLFLLPFASPSNDCPDWVIYVITLAVTFTLHALPCSLRQDGARFFKIYVTGKDIHTNSIEGFWSQLKRSINGTYHHVTAKHLQEYVDEYGFRYSHRKDEQPMFTTMLKQIVY